MLRRSHCLLLQDLLSVGCWSQELEPGVEPRCSDMRHIFMVCLYGVLTTRLKAHHHHWLIIGHVQSLPFMAISIIR